MINVQILEDTDVIRSGDHIRQLYIDYDMGGYADTISTTSCYGGGRINRMRWLTVDEVVPYWIGKKLKALHKRMRNGDISYEIVRGDLPVEHISIPLAAEKERQL